MMYLIFATEGHYQYGGLDDLKHTCNTVDEIKESIAPLFYAWEAIDVGWCDDSNITSLLSIWTHKFYHSRRLTRECEIADNEHPLSGLTNSQLEVASELKLWIAEYDIQHPEYRCSVCDEIKHMDDRVENVQIKGYKKPHPVCKSCAGELGKLPKGPNCTNCNALHGMCYCREKHDNPETFFYDGGSIIYR